MRCTLAIVCWAAILAQTSCIPNRASHDRPAAAPVRPPPSPAVACEKFEIAVPDPPYASAYAVAEGDPANACGVTTQGIAAAEQATLKALADRGAALSFTPWDHRTKPARLDAVKKRLGLTAAQNQTLMQQGFVVLATPQFRNY